MPDQNTIIVLVPGAWHSPSHYQDLLSQFEFHGYETHSIRLPSVGSEDPRSVTVSTDVAAAQQHLVKPFVDAGKNVIIIGHSYGAGVAGAAVEGFRRDQRSNGGAVIGFVVLCGYPAQKGWDLIQTASGSKGSGYAPWVDMSDYEKMGIVHTTDAKAVFYHDVPDDKAEKAVADLLPHAESSFSTPLPFDGYTDPAFDGRRAYIYALEDKSTPYEFVQKPVVQRTGVKWIEREINTSHSPFLSKPKETADIILDLVQEWESK